MNECTAKALVFSGRPDPVWKVKKAIVNELKTIWDSLDSIEGELQSAPSLGYRGCIIKCKGDIEWFVYKNLVTLKRGEKRESRNDNDMKFEKLVLSSAPRKNVPPFLIDKDCK